MEPNDDETMPPLEPSMLPPKVESTNTRLIAIGVMVTLVLVSFVAGAAFEKLQMRPDHGRGPEGGPMGNRGGPGGPGGPRGRGGPRPLQELLPDSLKLSDQQSRAVDSAMSLQLSALDSARVAFQPRLDSILKQTRARIDSILTPAQRAALPALRDDGFVPGFGPGDRRGGRGGPDRRGGADGRGRPDGRRGPPEGRGGPDGWRPPDRGGPPDGGRPPDRGAPPGGGELSPQRLKN